MKRILLHRSAKFSMKTKFKVCAVCRFDQITQSNLKCCLTITSYYEFQTERRRLCFKLIKFQVYFLCYLTHVVCFSHPYIFRGLLPHILKSRTHSSPVFVPNRAFSRSASVCRFSKLRICREEFLRNDLINSGLPQVLRYIHKVNWERTARERRQ